jgi:hypothetical protein
MSHFPNKRLHAHSFNASDSREVIQDLPSTHNSALNHEHNFYNATAQGRYGGWSHASRAARPCSLDGVPVEGAAEAGKRAIRSVGARHRQHNNSFGGDDRLPRRSAPRNDILMPFSRLERGGDFPREKKG